MVPDLVDRRFHDLARRGPAARRGGASEPITLDGGAEDGDPHRFGERPGMPFRSTTPSRMARRLEEAAPIQRALDDLPETDRSLVMSTVYDVVSVADAARRLGLGERVARTRLRQALSDLRVALDLVERVPGAAALGLTPAEPDALVAAARPALDALLEVRESPTHFNAPMSRVAARRQWLELTLAPEEESASPTADG